MNLDYKSIVSSIKAICELYSNKPLALSAPVIEISTIRGSNRKSIRSGTKDCDVFRYLKHNLQ